MKKIHILVLWLCATLFPLNWLRRQSALARHYFDAAFSAEWVHVVLHLLLYAGLVILIINTFNLPLTRRTALILVGIILAVATVQELFQLLSKTRSWNWWDSFDLLVDLLGGAIGWGLYRYSEGKMNTKAHKSTLIE